MNPAPSITPFHDASSGTVSYVVADATTRQAAVIDPVLDFDPKSGRTATASVEAIVHHLRREKLAVQWIHETMPDLGSARAPAGTRRQRHR